MNNNQSMTEKEMLTDLLNEEKYLVKQYAGDMTESASARLRQVLLANMTECATDQYSIFDQMRTRNMYKTKPSQPQEIQTAKQDMQQLKNQTGI